MVSGFLWTNSSVYCMISGFIWTNSSVYCMSLNTFHASRVLKRLYPPRHREGESLMWVCVDQYATVHGGVRCKDMTEHRNERSQILKLNFNNWIMNSPFYTWNKYGINSHSVFQRVFDFCLTWNEYGFTFAHCKPAVYPPPPPPTAHYPAFISGEKKESESWTFALLQNRNSGGSAVMRRRNGVSNAQ